VLLGNCNPFRTYRYLLTTNSALCSVNIILILSYSGYRNARNKHPSLAPHFGILFPSCSHERNCINTLLLMIITTYTEPSLLELVPHSIYTLLDLVKEVSDTVSHFSQSVVHWPRSSSINAYYRGPSSRGRGPENASASSANTDVETAQIKVQRWTSSSSRFRWRSVDCRWESFGGVRYHLQEASIVFSMLAAINNSVDRTWKNYVRMYRQAESVSLPKTQFLPPLGPGSSRLQRVLPRRLFRRP
jgi:hypothetical protein